jgi:hypothetical protein
MKTCPYCDLELGQEVILDGKNPFPCCGTVVDNTGKHALYIHFDGAFHYFRVFQSMRCPNCNQRGDKIALPCYDYDDGLFNVEDNVETETFYGEAKEYR